MRDSSISIAKGWAIMLMVLAHANFYKMGHDFIYMFHMPLFFVCSGYCFKDKYLLSPFKFVRQRIKGLYFPFVKWSLLFLLFHNIFFHLNIYNSEYTLEEFIRHGTNVILWMVDSEELLGGYWFLHTLFWAYIIFYITLKIVHERIIIGGGIVLLVSVLSLLVIPVPYFDIGYKEWLGSAFIFSGYYLKKMRLQFNWDLIIFFFFIVGITSFLMPASIPNVTLMTILPYFFVAVRGSAMVIGLSIKITGGWLQKIIEYIGDHTIDILTWHFLLFKIVSLLIIMIESRPLAHLAQFPVIYFPNGYNYYWPAYFVVGMGGALMISFFREKILSMKSSSKKLFSVNGK